MGKNGGRKTGAPSVDTLAMHFAMKLSLGGEENDAVQGEGVGKDGGKRRRFV